MNFCEFLPQKCTRTQEARMCGTYLIHTTNLSRTVMSPTLWCMNTYTSKLKYLWCLLYTNYFKFAYKWAPQCWRHDISAQVRGVKY